MGTTLAEPLRLRHPLHGLSPVLLTALVVVLHAALLDRIAAAVSDRGAPPPVPEVEIELTRPPPPPAPAAPPRRSAPAAPAAAVHSPPPVAEAPAAASADATQAPAGAATNAHAVPSSAADPIREAAATPQPYTGPSGHAGYLHNPVPAYPERARRLGWEGKTLLKVFVLASGRPERIEIEVSSGRPLLDEAARETVRGWTFAPARQGRTAVDGWVQVPIEFKLGR